MLSCYCSVSHWLFYSYFTVFLAVPALMSQQENILFFIYHPHRLPDSCTSENTSQFNTYVPLPNWVPTEEQLETWLRHCINNCTLLCFYSCVLLILRLPTLIFSHFRMIFPCYGLSYTLTLSRFYWIFVTGDQYIHRKTTRRRKCRQG